MLSELHVRNFALIEELDLEFGPGLNMLTGETGAGKSIIIGAINLILGGRAQGDLIRLGTDEAEVQALFTPNSTAELRHKLEENGLPSADEVLVRRVIPRKGRNRIYINGNPATLAQLASLCGDMVSISGQHEHQQLLDTEKQLLLLDRYGGLLSLRERMSEAFEQTVRLETETAGLVRRLDKTKQEIELIEFQVQEIQSAELAPGEDEQLEKEKDLLRNAETIYQLLQQSYDRLYERDGAVVEILDGVRSDLAKAARMDERLGSILAQVEDAFHQIDDAAVLVRDRLDSFTFNPAELEDLEERLALIHRLKRKYGPTLNEVMSYGESAAGQLDQVCDMEDLLVDLRRKVEEARRNAVEIANDLSEKRMETAALMSQELAGQLRSLGMPHLDFDISFIRGNPGVKPGPNGWDEIEFMISPNLGEQLKPLSTIASGGELSRTLLGLKSLLAGQDGVQTVIFDEVDAGIGGAVAEVVGRKISALAAHHQVLCITHLPQIAAFSNQHYQVYKEIRKQRTVTGIRPLDSEGKLKEIARMLGGMGSSEKALAVAGEMISNSSG